MPLNSGMRVPRVGRRRRRRRRRNNTRLPPIMRNQPTTFGPGTTIKYISQTLLLSNGFYNYNLLGLTMISSTEFTQSSLSYDYFKVEAVKIIFRAFNFTNIDYDIRFRFRWGIEAQTEEELLLDDQAKIIGPVNMRPKVYTFMPPPIMVSASGTNNKSIVMNDYQSVDDAFYPVSFSYKNYLPATRINIEWRVRFRGSSTYIPPTRVNKFLAAIEERNKVIMEEDKEEEEDEQQEVNQIKTDLNIPTYKSKPMKGIPSRIHKTTQ